MSSPAAIISGSLAARAKRLAFHGVCALKRFQGRFSRPKLVVYFAQRIFARKAEALADLLRERGFDPEIREGLSRNTRILLKSRPDLWIGFWNAVSPHEMPEHYIFWNAEPVGIERWDDEADWSDLSDPAKAFRWHESLKHRREWQEMMEHSKSVWGYTQANGGYVANLGVPFTFVPFGYAPYYEQVYQPSLSGREFQQDIDVLFFGWVTERRKRVLDRIAERGLKLHVVSQAKVTVEGELDELLARSKIILGIHAYDAPKAQIADFARFDFLLSNRLFALHERPSAVARHPAFEENVPVCDFDEIPDTCAYYLARPDERARRAEHAYQWFKTAHSLASFVPFDQVRSLLKNPRLPVAA